MLRRLAERALYNQVLGQGGCKMRIKSKVRLAAILVMALPGVDRGLSAQTMQTMQEVRDNYRNKQTIYSRDLCKFGSIEVSVKKGSGVLECELVNLDSAGKMQKFEFTKSLGFDVPGGIQWISGQRLLVSGRKSTGPLGMLYLLEIVENAGVYSLSVLRSAAYAIGGTPVGLDLTYIAYQVADGRIYAIDYCGRRLVAVAWANSEVPLPLPALAKWETVVAFTDDDMVVVPAMKVAGYIGGAHIHDSMGDAWGSYAKLQGVWARVKVQPETYPVIAVYNANQANVLGGLVITGPNGVYEIAEASSGVVVHTGQIVSNHAVADFTTPGLAPGRMYFAIGPSGSRASFRVHLRYGAPSPFGDTRLNPVELNLGAFFPGSGLASAGTQAVYSGSRENPVNMNIALWVGLRNPDGTDPVAIVDGVAYLTNPLTIIERVIQFSAGGTESEHFANRLSIPESGSVGNVYLFQYIAIDPGGQGVALSDVVGVEVSAVSASQASAKSIRVTNPAVNTSKPSLVKPSESAYKAVKANLKAKSPVPDSTTYQSILSLIKKKLKSRSK